MTGSKSSKSSSYHSSYQSDDNGIVTNVANFEEIGLDDEARSDPPAAEFVKSSLNPYDASFATDLRATARQQKRMPMAATNGNRPQRELTASPYRSPGMPPRSTTTDGLVLLPMHNGRNSTPVGLGLLPMRSGPKQKGPLNNASSRRAFMNHSTTSLPISARNRSLSPGQPSSQKHKLSVNQLRVRRGSWQSNHNRKSAEELERECDDDDGDYVPDDCFLENIPISPRPPQERTPSMPPSTSTSPDRAPKERVRSVGNGTSPIPAEQGEFRTPKPLVRSATMSDFPVNGVAQKGRAKSWTAVLSELSAEAQALTEALEVHAEIEQTKELEMRQRRSFGNSSALDLRKPARVRSAIAELPPLRRTNIMIDPLPVSKEKEAVLSRTRPSWLPPKDPAEEKRHLKEYQKMMALSAESDRKREADQRAKTTCKDDTAHTLLRIWEEHVLPNWDDVIRQKRTRELWWRGISPRSRGKVWAKAIGNELGLTDASYTAALRRAQGLEKTVKSGSQLTADEEKKKVWLDNIESDMKKTFPELRIFQPDGPLHEGLKDVLRAYAMYRSDVGYVHGTHVSTLPIFSSPRRVKSTCPFYILTTSDNCGTTSPEHGHARFFLPGTRQYPQSPTSPVLPDI
jgi:hypothetical protein